MTPEILAEKATRSHLETLSRNSKLPDDKLAFNAQASKVKRLITVSKRQYYRGLISTYHDNSKKLWNTLNTLLGRNSSPSLPSSDSTSSLAVSFLNFFNDKIVKLCSSIPAYPIPDVLNASLPEPPILASFTPASCDEIRKLIRSATDSSCSLDIIPTKLLKSCVDALLLPITHLINLSLSEGAFPTTFKQAAVYPLLKKYSLLKDDLSSYRPISNI